MTKTQILEKLHGMANPEVVSGAAYFGIKPTTTVYGIPVPHLRAMAKEIKKNHALAQELWLSGIHEARILATMIADPKKVTPEEMDAWVVTFDSWDLCDQCCSNAWCRTPLAYAKVFEWSEREEEYVKRAVFSLIAYLAVHDKKASDDKMTQFFPLIEQAASDDRNFVKKAVNWALRQIGKRNPALNLAAITVAERIQTQSSKSAKWIASDALKELQNPKILAALEKRAKPSV